MSKKCSVCGMNLDQEGMCPNLIKDKRHSNKHIAEVWLETQEKHESASCHTPLKNEGFGNRCVLCGSYFDEGGMCNCGHEKGGTYAYRCEKGNIEFKPNETCPHCGFKIRVPQAR